MSSVLTELTYVTTKVPRPGFYNYQKNDDDPDLAPETMRYEVVVDDARDQVALSNRFSSLSPRELQVMQRVVNGALNKQIAAELGIVEKTVKVHRAHLMEKTGVRSLAELVQLCTKAGIS